MKLSIIIPVYNAEGFIENTVDTIFEQKLNDFELIIVNDGSTDNSLEVCNRIVKTYDNVKVFSKENEGVSVARNYGVSKATGEWVTFVDADDGLMEGAFEELDDILNSEYELLLFDYTSNKNIANNFPNTNSSIDVDQLRRCVLNYVGYFKDIQKSGYLINTYNNWTCWGKLFKREIIVNNNVLFPKGITHGEDLVFLYKYYSNISKAIHINKVFYYYRLDNVSVTRRFNEKRIDNTKHLFEVLRENVNKEDEKELYAFICNRIFACCYLYFASNSNTASFSKKKKELSEFCKEDLVADAIDDWNADNKMSVGKKTDWFMKLVLNAIKNKRYALALLASKIFNRV